MRPHAEHEPALHEIVNALRETDGAATAPVESGAERAASSSDIEILGPRCAFCELAERSARRSLRAFFAEFVNDPQVRLRFRESRGFCRQHTLLLAECGDALGVAILYADLADATRQRWRAGAGSRKQKLFARLFSARGKNECPSCDSEAEAETRYIHAFAQGLRQDETLWDLLRSSNGLCVRHIELAADAADPRDASRLIQIETEKMDTLSAELEEFVRKNDYRFRGETWGTERNAWRRALIRLRRQ